MPWELRQRDDKWCVVKATTDETVPGGCHDSRDDAAAHMRALYANEPGARTAAMADAFPLDPPEEWFAEMPAWFQPGMKGSLATDGPDAGRFAATVAARGTFILSGTGDKWRSPPSPSNYEEAHQGDTYTASGHVVRTANLAMDTNHVPIHASYERARDLMAHTGTAVARVRYMDVGGHTVALGAAWPGLTDLQVRKLQASALSGDWRWREEYGGYDMAGSVVVNNPALPLKGDRPVFQPYAMAASLGLEHPPIYGSWVCDDEGNCSLMPPEPTVNLNLSATDVQALHRVLTNPAILAAVAEPAAPCSCQSHTAAVGDPALAEAVAPEMGAPTREEFDALARQVEELQGQIMSDALADVDGMVAALPLPPDLEDERHKMPPPFEKKDPPMPDGPDDEDEKKKRRELVNA